MLQYPAFLFLAAFTSSQRYNVTLTRKINTITLWNFNVQITLFEVDLKDVVGLLFLLQEYPEI